MLKVKSQVWTNPQGKRFIVMPEDDFEQIAELLEDQGLSRILKEAKRTDTSKPSIPLSAVKRRISAARRSK